MNLTLKIWRQKDRKSKGDLKTYKVKDISKDSSFLETGSQSYRRPWLRGETRRDH